MDFKQYISNTPMSNFQLLIITLIIVLNILNGFDVFSITFTAKSIQNELNVDNLQIGILLSSGMLGLACGSIFLAPVADKIGRRLLLIIATSLAAFGMLLTIFVHSILSISLCRFITCVGAGAILPCANVLVSELSNKKWRGLAIAIYVSSFSMGAAFCGYIAVEVLSTYDYRIMFLIGFLLTFSILIFVLFFIPESVDFLLSNPSEKSEKQLIFLAKKMKFNADIQLKKDTKKLETKISVFHLLEKEYRHNFILISIAFISIMAAFYFIVQWTPAILEMTGISKENSSKIGVALLLGGSTTSILFGFLVSRWDTNKILMIFILGAAVMIALFMFNKSLFLAFPLAVLVGGLINGCIAGLYTITPNLFPIELRSSGVGIAIGIGRLGSILSPIIAGKLLDIGILKTQLYLGTSLIVFVAFIAILFLKKP